MNTKGLAKAGAGHPMLYGAKTEAIETRRVKIRKLMARGITGSQMASMLGVDAEVVYKDIASIRNFIAKELQGSDALALVAESLGVLDEVRASALKDMDKAETPFERSIARRDVIRVEAERMKCVLLATGGMGGRGMINITNTIEGDPVPLLEDQHQKVIDVARQLLGEVFQMEGNAAPFSQPNDTVVNCKEEGP
ncbi:MAG: hypothetical protein HQL07_03085 [Nitrospirae bacterium]|nr:hypothetical protein [Magnetococcales bacterium]HAT50430.1 hypothetical protein [Alphaproteobacteria bacterium]